MAPAEPAPASHVHDDVPHTEDEDDSMDGWDADSDGPAGEVRAEHQQYAIECATQKRSWTRWTAEDHALLMQLVAKHGSNRCWSLIATHITGRTGKQCRERWLNHMTPESKRGSWSADEEYTLTTQHSMNGSQWSRITRMLPGRTDNGVKNHWNAMWRSKVMYKPQSILWLYTVELKQGHNPPLALRRALCQWELNVPSQVVLATLHFRPSRKFAGMLGGTSSHKVDATNTIASTASTTTMTCGINKEPSAAGHATSNLQAHAEVAASVTRCTSRLPVGLHATDRTPTPHARQQHPPLLSVAEAAQSMIQCSARMAPLAFLTASGSTASTLMPPPGLHLSAPTTSSLASPQSAPPPRQDLKPTLPCSLMLDWPSPALSALAQDRPRPGQGDSGSPCCNVLSPPSALSEHMACTLFRAACASGGEATPQGNDHVRGGSSSGAREGAPLTMHASHDSARRQQPLLASAEANTAVAVAHPAAAGLLDAGAAMAPQLVLMGDGQLVYASMPAEVYGHSVLAQPIQTVMAPGSVAALMLAALGEADDSSQRSSCGTHVALPTLAPTMPGVWQVDASRALLPAGMPSGSQLFYLATEVGAGHPVPLGAALNLAPRFQAMAAAPLTGLDLAVGHASMLLPHSSSWQVPHSSEPGEGAPEQLYLLASAACLESCGGDVAAILQSSSTQVPDMQLAMPAQEPPALTEGPQAPLKLDAAVARASGLVSSVSLPGRGASTLLSADLRNLSGATTTLRGVASMAGTASGPIKLVLSHDLQALLAQQSISVVL